MTSKQWVSLVIVAVVFAGGGFFGGVKYEASKKPAVTASRSGQFAGTGAAGGFGGAVGLRDGGDRQAGKRHAADDQAGAFPRDGQLFARADSARTSACVRCGERVEVGAGGGVMIFD